MSATTALDSPTAGGPSSTISVASSLTSSLSNTITDIASSAFTASLNGTLTTSSTSSTTTSATEELSEECDFRAGCASKAEGIGLVAFLTALAGGLIVFGVQVSLFFILRNKLARIFKPKTYLVPERERTDTPPNTPWALVKRLWTFNDREIINKCGLDAYFFLRYLRTLLLIFIPIACTVIPILVPLNYSDGWGDALINVTSSSSNSNESESTSRLFLYKRDDDNTEVKNVTGLDTLAWVNIKPEHSGRYDAHLFLAILVIIWVCTVFFSELKIYIKIRQDYLTTAEHRLRASATTVLVNSIPKKWLSEKALTGLFDVFPGGIRNVWLTRDYSELLEKIHMRDKIHLMLEAAETELIRQAKKRQLKKREREEARERKEARQKAMTRQERAERSKLEDQNAHRLAESGGGISSGHCEVPQDVAGAVEESRHEEAARERYRRESRQTVPTLGTRRTTTRSRSYGSKNEEEETDFELSNGLMLSLAEKDVRPGSRGIQIPEELGSRSFDGQRDVPQRGHTHTASGVSHLTQGTVHMDNRGFGNTVRRVTNLDDMFVNEKTKWYQFWKPPPGGYASPIPQGDEGDEFPLTGSKQEKRKSFWSKLNVFSGEPLEPVEYPEYCNFDDATGNADGAEWEKWIKKSERPTHRLARHEWTPDWLPGLPFLNKKVDTIYWCRKELARLNMEIEYDQKNPDRYPLMNSAFIQFNHQVAAHMACQSVTHHVPKHMAPRDIEISPTDVIWDNMAISWWQGWLRTAIVLAIVSGMVILWAIPVTWSAGLANVDSLVETVPWLEFLKENDAVWRAVGAAAGVLPAVFLALVLVIVPLLFDILAGLQGCKTGAQKTETVQIYFFVFLFVQVFLVVSIASGALDTLRDFTEDVGKTVSDIPSLLAENLPSAANYFFSYMILQALSTSSGTLLQIGTLFVWYIIARILDSTARAKFNRNTRLPRVVWGSFFPIYTNFACIALIYSIVAPIISIFAIITFSLLWIAHRYNMIYVTRFENDTGGVLYPRAINQTFTGIYVMELCLVGLFFAVRDENDSPACTSHAITMIVMMILTVIYQYLLNHSFSPLFRYLPITFEDEAVLRDEAFQYEQARRLGLAEDDDEKGQELIDKPSHDSDGPIGSQPDEIELQKMANDEKGSKSNAFSRFAQAGKINPVRGIVHASTWAAHGAARGGKNLHKHTIGRAESNIKSATTYRRSQRQKDLEAQQAIGDALYGGFHDEIEDLTPEERDMLVRHAFQHYALRSRRPVVWIPRDDLGISDDEIRRTKEFSDFVWISNEGTALDSNVRVVYGKSPPDFSEVDLINL